MISRTEEYALRAVVHIARHGAAGPCRARDIARETGIPANYLSRILHQLARSGVVASERGRAGGFRLAADPGDIRLADVVAPFGAAGDGERCVLGRRECSGENPCGAHARWVRVREARHRFFASTTVGDVLDG